MKKRKRLFGSLQQSAQIGCRSNPFHYVSLPGVLCKRPAKSGVKVKGEHTDLDFGNLPGKAALTLGIAPWPVKSGPRNKRHVGTKPHYL